MMKEEKNSYVRFLKENEASKQASKEKEGAQQGLEPKTPKIVDERKKI